MTIKILYCIRSNYFYINLFSKTYVIFTMDSFSYFSLFVWCWHYICCNHTRKIFLAENWQEFLKIECRWSSAMRLGYRLIDICSETIKYVKDMWRTTQKNRTVWFLEAKKRSYYIRKIGTLNVFQDHPAS